MSEEMSDFLLNAYPSRWNGTRNLLCQQGNIWYFSTLNCFLASLIPKPETWYEIITESELDFSYKRKTKNASGWVDKH